MNDAFLKSRLLRVAQRYRWVGITRSLAACWASTALIGLAIIWGERSGGWSAPFALPFLAALAAGVATGVAIWHFQREPDWRWIARRIESAHPELQGVLLTAVQQTTESAGSSDFLSHRVLQEAITRSQEQDWRRVVPTARLIAMQLVHAVALGCLVVVLAGLRGPPTAATSKEKAVITVDGVAVTPGDTTIERGDTFVVLARFQRTLPADVNLVVRASGVAPRTIPLVKSLADPVFGGSVPDVVQDFSYRLEYGRQQTREFKVTVFEHPRLVRADANLVFPTYTKLAPKHIEDTRRLSAVQGTRVDLALQLNKAVTSAKFVARDPAKTTIMLVVDAAKPEARLTAWTPEKTQTYDLQLIDAAGRSNKVAASFVIDVQPNRPPEIRLTSPRGDVRPSALEEISFEGTVWDDFGAPAYGFAYSISGGETKSVELGHELNAQEKRSFSRVLPLEQLGAKPGDLISWYVWADDMGPDGNRRRTPGDLYFAEVRPFDEIFRESQGMQSAENQNQPPQGNETRRLTDLQKQIISATWKLQRDGANPNYGRDADVVRESQQQAITQAQQALENTGSTRDQALWRTATDHMQHAIERLTDAAQSPGKLALALGPEQAAYQTLLSLDAHETAVTRGQRNRSNGAGGQAGRQRQIDQLDLQQAENRYETQRQAQAPQTAERREQLAVMNRLQELARRQQDLNERLKELQASLQEARTDAEREELRKRLKRLEDEQRQMLADADEVRQRMNRPENQSSMANERQQLDQTRDDLQRAAEAASQGSVAQAVASGTRAQRRLQAMRDEMRKQNSSQFADDLKQMRNDARDLSRQQDELDRKIAEQGATAAQRKTLGEAGDHQDLVDALARQKERMNKLTDRAGQISEQAENSEPLLSKQLYDSLRKLSQEDANAVKELEQELLANGQLTFDLRELLQQTAEQAGGGKALDLTGEMLRQGNLGAAGQAGERSRAEVEELKRGVERAAESVLGDDAEQMKLARSELDQLTEQLQQEMSQNSPGQPQNQNPPSRDTPRAERTAANDSTPSSTANDRAASDDRGAQTNSPPSREPLAGDQAGADNRSRAGKSATGTADAPASREGTRGGTRGGMNIDTLLSGGVENGGGGVGRQVGGPLTGDGFAPWTERLRDVEQLLDAPDLRDAVATARERMRLLRRDVTQQQKKPDWAVVKLEVLKPLVEVRTRVAEELARRETKDSLAPIDHDPVPNRFAESVRRYYEELGKDK
jgi:hypothetical protein